MDKNRENFSTLLNSSMGIALGFLISGILSIFTRILLGRFLEPSGYGLLSEGLAVLNFFVIFGLLGMDQGVARFISFKKAREKNVIAALSISFPLSLLLTGLIFFSADYISLLVNNQELASVIRVFSLNIPAYTGLTVIIAGFRGEKNTKKKVLLSDATLPLFIFFSAPILAFLYSSVAITALGYLISGWATFLIASIIYIRERELFLPSIQRVFDLLKFSLPLTISSYASFGLIWANIVLLGYFIGSESAGLYNAALPISYALTLGLSAVNYIFLPLTSNSYSRNENNEIEKMYDLVVRWLTAFSLPLLFLLIIESDFIITTLFGSAYAPAALALAIIALGRFTDVFFGPLGQMLVGLGKTKQEALARLTGLIALLFTGLLLIPRFEVLGASIGFLIGFSLTNLLRLGYTRKEIKINPLKKHVLKPLIASIVATPILLLGYDSLPVEIGLIAGFCLTYLTVFVALKPLKPEDIQLFEDLAEEIELNDKIKAKITGVLKRCQ